LATVGLENLKKTAGVAINFSVINAGNIGSLTKITGTASIVLGVRTEDGNFGIKVDSSSYPKKRRSVKRVKLVYN